MRSSMTKLRSTKKFEIVLDSNKLKWFYMSCAAALPQLDRGSDYESERHRFESYTPHQLNLKPPATGAFLNMRKPLSIGMFVRARFETGLFRFPSGEPAHAAWLSRRLPGKLISAGSCGCASGGQPGMSAHPTAFRFSVRRYRTNPVFCRARPRSCPSKRS